MRFLIFFVLIFSICRGQDESVGKMNIFTYRLSYLPDSANVNDRREEDFDLQIIDHKSCFVSTKYKFMIQNLRLIEASKLDIASSMGKAMKLPKTKFTSVIYKDKGNSSQYEKLYTYGLHYDEKLMFNWKLKDEKKVIGEYKCKKAILNYGGRTWEAWYTEEIPISEGPYKFSGLPGMIIEIHDVHQNFSFSLFAIEANKDYEMFYDESFTKYKDITKKEFFSTRENLKNNLIQDMESQGKITFRPEDKAAIQRRVSTRKTNYIELR